MSEEILLCVKCLSLYRRDMVVEQTWRGSKAYFCPNIENHCFPPMLVLDDGISRTIRNFLSLRDSVCPLYSCEGHLLKGDTPYICFGEVEDGTHLDKFYALLKEMPFDLTIGDIKTQLQMAPGRHEKEPHRMFSVYRDFPISADEVDLAKRKAEFLQYMNAFFLKVKEAIRTW